jgi:hypothetical protein
LPRLPTLGPRIRGVNEKVPRITNADQTTNYNAKRHSFIKKGHASERSLGTMSGGAGMCRHPIKRHSCLLILENLLANTCRLESTSSKLSGSVFHSRNIARNLTNDPDFWTAADKDRVPQWTFDQEFHRIRLRWAPAGEIFSVNWVVSQWIWYLALCNQEWKPQNRISNTR